MKSVNRRNVDLVKSAIVITMLMTIVWMIASSFISQTNPGTIGLKPVKQNFIPTEFYINSVADFRINKGAVGNLVQLGIDKNTTSTIEANLDGGTINAVKFFFAKSLPVNLKLRPINIRLKVLTISEEKQRDSPINGSIELALEFYIQRRDADDVHLLSYRGKAKYQRNSNQKSVIEQAMQQTFSNALIYFNTFINREAPINVKLAKSVKLIFSDYVKQDPDTVYYSKARPLTWNDFKGTLSSSKYAAYIYPDFAYNQKISIENGVIQVNFDIRVFLAKSSSWVNSSNRNSYVLNHEQRHFDIEKIFAEKFKRDLKAEALTPDNFEGIINVQYLETRREIHRMQEKYDDETNHGINASQQMSWNKFIDEQLSKYNIK